MVSYFVVLRITEFMIQAIQSVRDGVKGVWQKYELNLMMSQYSLFSQGRSYVEMAEMLLY